MGKLERLIAALAALVTIPTFAFFVYDRFWGSGAAGSPAIVAPPPSTPTSTPAPAAAAAPAATPAPSPVQPVAASAAAPAPPPTPAKPAEKKLVFLCTGKQTPTFAPNRNSSPAVERFRNMPETVEMVFDFSQSRKSGTADVLLNGANMKWSEYSVGVQLAGALARYNAAGASEQSPGVTLKESGEVNFDTLGWTATRLLRSSTTRGPKADIAISGKCEVLESPKPKPSDDQPQWRLKPENGSN